MSLLAAWLLRRSRETDKMECFFASDSGFKCGDGTEARFHPIDKKWIRLCTRCARVWDEELPKAYFKGFGEALYGLGSDS